MKNLLHGYQVGPDGITRELIGPIMNDPKQGVAWAGYEHGPAVGRALAGYGEVQITAGKIRLLTVADPVEGRIPGAGSSSELPRPAQPWLAGLLVEWAGIHPEPIQPSL